MITSLKTLFSLALVLGLVACAANSGNPNDTQSSGQKPPAPVSHGSY